MISNLRPFVGTTAFLSLFDSVFLSRHLFVEGSQRKLTDTDTEYFAALGLILVQNLAFVAAICCALVLVGRLHGYLEQQERISVHADWGISGLVGVPIAIYLSAGDGLSRWMPRAVAAILLIAILVGAGRVFLASMRRLYPWLISSPIESDHPLPRATARLGLVIAAVGALLADRWILVGLYQPLHLLSAAGAVGLVGVALTYRGHNGPALHPLLLAGLAVIGVAISTVSSNWAPLAHTRAVLAATGPRHNARVANKLAAAINSAKRSNSDPSRQANSTRSVFEFSEQPHVFIISIDGVRASHTSLLGHSRETTPFLSQLSQDALIFERAYSPASNTQNSLAGILSNGTVEVRKPASGVDLEQFCADQPVGETLPATFADAGYRTLCDFAYARRELSCAALECQMRLDTRDREKTFEVLWEMLGSSSQPIFALAHLLETHAPYTGFKDEMNTSHPNWSRYERSIYGMDEALRRLFERANDLTERPILWIFVSDHGEALGDHGHQTHDSSLFEEQVHVPMILTGAGIRPGRISQPVSTQWLYGTLRPLTGEPADGNVLPIEPTQTPSEPVFLHNKSWYGVVDGKWKYIEDRTTAARWLFDLESDPNELNNLLGEESMRARQLEKLVDQRFAN